MVGQIMIGTGIFSSSQTVLSQVIEEFHDEYPLVKFDIYVGNARIRRYWEFVGTSRYFKI